MTIINLIYNAPRGWQPGANTIAYYPLETDVNDASGNGNNMTNSGITFGTYAGVTCAYCNSNYAYKSGNTLTGNPTFTVSAWVKKTASSGINIWGFGSGNNNYGFCLWFNNNVLQTGGWNNDRNTGITVDNNRHHIVWAYSSGSGTIYIDGQSVYSGTWNPNIQSTRMTIGSNANQTDKWQGYLSKIIFEDKQRTAEDVANYYNRSKGDYGL